MVPVGQFLRLHLLQKQNLRERQRAVTTLMDMKGHDLSSVPPCSRSSPSCVSNRLCLSWQTIALQTDDYSVSRRNQENYDWHSIDQFVRPISSLLRFVWQFSPIFL